MKENNHRYALNLRISKEIFDKVKRRSEEEERTISVVIRRILTQYFEDKESKERVTPGKQNPRLF